MHKIYTRNKIKIPAVINGVGKKLSGKKGKKFSIFIIILIIAFSTVKLMLDAILPIFNTLCEDKAKSIATIVSNEQATEVMREHSYDELFTIEKDNNGNITMVKSNVIPINEIISDVAIRIQNEIDNKGRDNVEIALGSFTGFKLLAGKGPGIKITISSIGNIDTDLRSEFTAQGINQTLHRVYLQVKCQVSILTPFENITKDITNQVLLMENVIVGQIPNTYYNIDGTTTRDAMELIE